MYHHFLMREYPKSLIQQAMLRASSITQNEALRPECKDTSNKCFYCIIDYNPSNPDVKFIINEALKLANRSSSTRELLKIPIIFGFRKSKSIADSIIRTDLPNTELNFKGESSPKCKRFPKCKYCPYIQNRKRNKIVSTSMTRRYTIPTKVSCNSKNLIYCIECPMCKLQYIG